MKNTRKGLGKGLGMGYKNIAPMDSHIHSLSAKGVMTALDKWNKLPKNHNIDVATLEKEIKELEAQDEVLRKRSFGERDKFALRGINSTRNAIWRKIQHKEYLLDDLKATKLSKKQLSFMIKNYGSLGEMKDVERIYGATTRSYEVKVPEGKFQVDDDYMYGLKGSPRSVSVKRLNAKFLKNRGIVNAEKVFSLVSKNFKSKKGTQYLGTYHNGRENGLVLNLYLDNPVEYKEVEESKTGAYVETGKVKKSDSVSFIIAENRNSDDIILYEDYEYSSMLDELSEGSYKNRKYFNKGDYKKVADYVTKRIKSLDKQGKIYWED